MDLIERMAQAIYRQYEDRPIYAQIQMNGILADELAKAALSAIRETHAVVPRKLIDDLADANSGGDWGEACDAITLWARDRAGEVKP